VTRADGRTQFHAELDAEIRRKASEKTGLEAGDSCALEHTNNFQKESISHFFLDVHKRSCVD
jgi:hypothetical protein